MSQEQFLVIYEPNGSIGAPWLLEALPESRLIFLIRDPRDVVASVLDGFRKGGWIYAEQYLTHHEESRNQELATGHESARRQMGPDSPADTNPNEVAEARARRYLRDIGSVKQAFDFHDGHKVMVRYEDLRANTLGTMKRMYAALEIDVDDEELARVVDVHAWENIAEDRKGKGKVRRKATPGGWKEDLTPEQAKSVETITGPLLDQFYSEHGETV